MNRVILPGSIPTSARLEEISSFISDRLRESLLKEGTPVDCPNGLAVRYSTNELVMLVGRQVDSGFKYQLVVANLDKLSDLPKAVCVHNLTFQTNSESPSKFGLLRQDVFPFQLTNLVLNKLETSFVSYGKSGVIIGNFAAHIENVRAGLVIQAERPVKSLDIEVEIVMNKASGIRQIEFCGLNTNCLLMLDKNSMQVIDLHVFGCPVVRKIDVATLAGCVEKEIVAFSQSC